MEQTDKMEHCNSKDGDDEVGWREEEAVEHKEEHTGRRCHTLQPWRPIILASPSGTSYAGYGPGDVAIVEPPHRGDSPHVLGESAKIPTIGGDGSTSASIIPAPPDDSRRASTLEPGSGDSAAGNSNNVEDDYAMGERGLKELGEATAPMLLHKLVAQALLVGKGREEQFRIDFQALLYRYVDHKKANT